MHFKPDSVLIENGNVEFIDPNFGSSTKFSVAFYWKPGTSEIRNNKMYRLMELPAGSLWINKTNNIIYYEYHLDG